MQRTLLSIPLVLCFATPVFAYDAQDAAECAAFSMGNWDFEVERFDQADQSPEWKQQAGGFLLVSERLGFSRTQVNATIRSERGAYKDMVGKFLFGDRKAEAAFNRISDTCDEIFDTAPEMKPFK